MGGKARSVETTSTTELPPTLEMGANEVISAGLRSASLPYRPNKGVTVAALTPQQMAAMNGANAFASAFGMPTGDFGIPQPQESGMEGLMGYSTRDPYREMMDASMTIDDRRARNSLLRGYGEAADRVAALRDDIGTGGGGDTRTASPQQGYETTGGTGYISAAEQNRQPAGGTTMNVASAKPSQGTSAVRVNKSGQGNGSFFSANNFPALGGNGYNSVAERNRRT